MKKSHDFIHIIINDNLIGKCQDLNGLTPSEVNVLTKLATGINMKEFADFSENTKTLSSHKRNAYKKIGISNDIQFIYYLYQLKLYGTEFK